MGVGKVAGLRPRLLALGRARGAERRTLAVGPWILSIEGLDPALAGALDLRWGGFIRRTTADRPVLTLRLYEDDQDLCAGRWEPGERYAMRGEIEDGLPLMTTYNLVTSPENPGGAVWRAAVAATSRERPDRVVENGVRYLVARLAVAGGGLALHGAGVLRGRRAFVFAGPSRSGKTTAVGLSSDATSLGDDFAVLLPREGGWRTAAVPFDNLERGPADPPRDLFPVAGVWRLFQADEAAIETPAGPQAVASLMSCAAFPWAMPDLAAAVLEHAQRFVSESCFGHLRFGRDPDFWRLLPA